MLMTAAQEFKSEHISSDVEEIDYSYLLNREPDFDDECESDDDVITGELVGVQTSLKNEYHIQLKFQIF